MLNSGLFSPATIMPEQFADGSRAELPPEHRLMIAILEDAINCFSKHSTATGRSNRRLFREAEEWIMAEHRHGPFSFEYVCSFLNLDARGVRRSLRHKHAQDGRTSDLQGSSHVKR